MSASERYVVLGLARRRALWIRNVSQWATSAAIPAEFAMCVSPAELLARLDSGRAHSAVLLDGGLGVIDRDLVDRVREAGCAVFVVDDEAGTRNWRNLGVHAVLSSSFTRAHLLDELANHARLVGHPTVASLEGVVSEDGVAPEGVLVAVCGPGGTGASTVAAALAQGLGARSEMGRIILLADFAHHAQQAMLHDVGDVGPGIQELADAHRLRHPGDDEVDAMLFDVVARRYHLLLGLRAARHWSMVRPKTFAAALATLRRRFEVTIADVDADFEGETDGGSVDVEERNAMARTVVHRADVVFAVGAPGMKGLHSLVRVVGDLVRTGVGIERIVVVVNQAPRHPRARAELSATIDALLPVPVRSHGLPSPIFLPVRRVESAWRDGAAFPAPLPSTLARAYDATMRRVGRQHGGTPEPELVRPGSFGGLAE